VTFPNTRPGQQCSPRSRDQERDPEHAEGGQAQHYGQPGASSIVASREAPPNENIAQLTLRVAGRGRVRKQRQEKHQTSDNPERVPKLIIELTSTECGKTRGGTHPNHQS